MARKAKNGGVKLSSVLAFEKKLYHLMGICIVLYGIKEMMYFLEIL